jgi:hypothetical protein
MRKVLPIGSAIFPLLVAAVAFKWFPRSDLLGPVIIASLLLGWIGIGFSFLPKRWLKVLILVAYPFVMWIAITAVMVLVYGIPGL